jgi:hypothetical protein
LATFAEIMEEDGRMRQLELIVRLTSHVIAQGNLTRSEAQAYVASARARILELFPGREETFELLYRRRFERLILEFSRPDPGSPVWVC